GLIDEWKRKRWPELKKSRERGPHDRLHRRKWFEPTASSAAHLGAPRTDTCAPVSLQLENALGHRRRHRLELLLSDLRTSDQVRADHRVSQTFTALYRGRHSADLGPAPGSPQ